MLKMLKCSLPKLGCKIHEGGWVGRWGGEFICEVGPSSGAQVTRKLCTDIIQTHLLTPAKFGKGVFF
jgi:hypothetical protein